MKQERLQAALGELEQQGVLSAEQRAAVTERLLRELPAPKDRMGTFVRIIAMLGALLVAAGILLFIAANWDGMGKGLKLALIFGTLLGVHHLGFRWAEEPGNSPALGHAFTGLGVLLFGGAIGLVAQIYHLSSDYPWVLLWWWVLGLPFALLTRSGAIFAVVLALFLLWLGWHTGWWLDHGRSGNSREYLMMFSLLGLSTAALFRGLAANLPRLGFREFETPLRLFGTPLGLAGLYMLSFHEIQPWRDDHELGAATFLHPGFLGGLAVLLLFSALIRPEDRDDARVGLSTLGAALLLGMCAALSPETVYLLANAMLFVGLLMLIAFGVRRGKPLSINYGIAGFLGLVLTRYFEYVGSHLDPFWAFIMAGAILLGLGRWLERQRRGWVAAAATAAGAGRRVS